MTNQPSFSQERNRHLDSLTDALDLLRTVHAEFVAAYTNPAYYTAPHTSPEFAAAKAARIRTLKDVRHAEQMVAEHIKAMRAEQSTFVNRMHDLRIRITELSGLYYNAGARSAIHEIAVRQSWQDAVAQTGGNFASVVKDSPSDLLDAHRLAEQRAKNSMVILGEELNDLAYPVQIV